STDGTLADDGVARLNVTTYNELGEVVSVGFGYHPTTTTTTNTYAGGLLTASTDWAGNTTTYLYDGVGRLIETTCITCNPNWTTTTRYDAVGNVIETVDQLGHATRYFYDNRNRRIQTIYADGTITRAIYDAAG